MNSEEKLLLIWEMFPEENEFYILQKNSELANLARNCNGLHINGDDLEENHEIFKLSELLLEEEKIQTPIENIFITEVVSCGWFL